MTVLSELPFESYFGDGVAVEYPFNMPAIFAGDVFGFVDGVSQSGSAVLNPDQDSGSGGVFTFDDPPPANSEVVIIRITDKKQLTNYPPYTPFPSRLHEKALDKLTMIVQELAYQVAIGGGGDGGDGGDGSSAYVLRTGDSMSGHLNVLSTTPETSDTVAPQKGYVDGQIFEKVKFYATGQEAEDAAAADSGFGLHCAPEVIEPEPEGIVVVQTGSNSNGSYRIWSDGFIEQIGNEETFNSQQVKTLTFPVAITAPASSLPIISEMRRVDLQTSLSFATSPTTTSIQISNTGSGTSGKVARWGINGY